MNSPHNLSFENIANQFGINYLLVNNKMKLEDVLNQNFNRPSIIELSLDKEENQIIYNKLKTMDESNI